MHISQQDLLDSDDLDDDEQNSFIAGMG